MIREAIASDSDALSALYRELVDDGMVDVCGSQISRMREAENCFLLVSETADGVCGTALVTICEDAMYGTQPFAVLENVVVLKKHQGLGIGTALIQEVDRLCIERDCSKIILTSSRPRSQAHLFFAHRGYRGDLKMGFVKYNRHFRETYAGPNVGVDGQAGLPT